MCLGMCKANSCNDNGMNHYHQPVSLLWVMYSGPEPRLMEDWNPRLDVVKVRGDDIF